MQSSKLLHFCLCRKSHTLYSISRGMHVRSPSMRMPISWVNTWTLLQENNPLSTKVERARKGQHRKVEKKLLPNHHQKRNNTTLTSLLLRSNNLWILLIESMNITQFTLLAIGSHIVEEKRLEAWYCGIFYSNSQWNCRTWQLCLHFCGPLLTFLISSERFVGGLGNNIQFVIYELTVRWLIRII